MATRARDAGRWDPAAERDMGLVIRIVTAIRRCRQRHQLPRSSPVGLHTRDPLTADQREAIEILAGPVTVE